MRDPLFRRIRQHAQKRLQFPVDTPQNERVDAYREFLRLERTMLLRYHRNGDPGTRVAHAHAIIIDVLIENMFKYAVSVYEKEHGKLRVKVSTLALGGYGRNELCPLSDIDIMFLYPNRMVPATLNSIKETLTNQILYPMWDLSLKVGHSSRSVKDALEEARSNIQSKNSMLEARLICGSRTLFSKFQQTYKRFYQTEDPSHYLQAALNDQSERRKRFGNSVFMQEPNIKNGVGGLRDYQNILWMANIRHQAGSMWKLYQKKLISKKEYRQMQEAYNFLLRTRNELHFINKRPTDSLSLEQQPEIAHNLGYTEQDIFKRVEAFMHDYYTHAHNIHLTSRWLEKRFQITDMPGKQPVKMKDVIASRRYKPRQTVDDFIIEDGEFNFAKKTIFQEDPLRLLRVFRHMQGVPNGRLSLELYGLIRDSDHLITPKMIFSSAANKTFRSILQEIGNVYPVLSLMHELGILGRFVPEFGELTCLVQHEYYHIYTADIHTLACIRELDEIFSGEHPERQKYLDAIRATNIPGLLYLILLLHDIGKAKGIKGHAAAGVELARPILKRMEIRPEHEEQILFIIDKHFEMARFTLNYDIDDPRTAEAFAKQMKTPDNLRYLYVHNFCDARGTSHDLWNSYKDSLSQTLFTNTLNLFKDSEAVARERKETVMRLRENILSRKPEGLTKEEIDAHFNLLPERYFINNSEEEILQHLHMVHDLLTTISAADSIGSLRPVIDWHNDKDQNFTVINVVTWDRAGLFYKLAGALTVAGLNIISTKAITRADHITIDTFYVVDSSGGMVSSESVKKKFEECMEASLLRNEDLLPKISAYQKSTRSAYGATPSRLRTPIPPKVDIYHELSLKRTIVEVQTNDHAGLLYQLAKSIYDHGFDITFARISTERGVAIDSFYIENINHGTPTSTSHLVELRESINRIVADSYAEATA